MPKLETNGVEIAYETFGEDYAPAVLMIMGLGAQLTMWPDDMIEALVAAGYRVVIMDNRDIGLSTKFEGAKLPNPIAHALARRVGLRPKVPYSLDDMTRDAAGLLSELKIDRAHLVGVSMGGMIAQHLSAYYPQLIASLTAIMTATGNPKLPRPSREIIKRLFFPGPPPKGREQIIDRMVETFSVIGTPGEDQNTNGMRDRLTLSYDRSYSPTSIARQSAAILSSGDFRKVTRSVKAPTLVIHGDADPLVSIEGGREITRLVDGAKLRTMRGMGHDMPPRFRGEIIEHMVTHIQSVDAAA